MKNKFIIIGHKNPDTDSIVSSIVAEDYFKTVLKSDAKAMRAGELNNDTKFILKKFGIETPSFLKTIKKDEKVILVDHNEKGQIADAIDMTSIDGVIDHHKVVLETEGPIFLRFEPVGSTSSILTKMFKEAGKKISPRNAKLLLSGILSDTLNLTSPTTTDFDKKIVKELNKIAKLDLKKFVDELFAAKSSLEGLTIVDIVSQDYKIFEMGGKKIGIGVRETTSTEIVNEKKGEIMKLLVEKKSKEKLDYILFFVVDIIKQNSILYIVDEEEKKLAEKVFKAKASGDSIFLKGIVSRKKQIVPPLTKELNK